MPLLPHEVWSSCAHSLSGSVPMGTASQKPSRKRVLHFSQVPPQRDSQQMPSVQKPLPHSVSAAQAMPCAFLHAPDTHELPAWHSALLAQLVRQAPVAGLQVKGEQPACVDAWQTPLPSQVREVFDEVPSVLQKAGAHCVPDV